MRYKVKDRRGLFPSWALALTFPYFTSGFMISGNATAQTGNQQQMATATTVCQNTIDSCIMYGWTPCTNKVYEAWAKAHCAMYCGFCTPSVPLTSLCDNKILNCKEYDSGDLCTEPSYSSWAYKNCRGYCKFGVCKDNVCEDRNGINCMLLDAAVNICDDVQKAKIICRKHCSLCNVTDGEWCPWETWSSCDVTCGNGTNVRSRQCACDAPANGGDYCNGDAQMTKACPVIPCPVVHGHWTSWSSWSKCDTHCVKKRTRSCTNPAPSAFVHTCIGNSEDRDNCGDQFTCSITVRLRGGNTSRSGRVEVSHDGINWGTVCDDFFDVNNNGAKVVCRMLGYPTSGAQHYRAKGGSGPIFLDNVNCTGSEKSLLYCQHNLWNITDCTHPEDVGVRCD